LVSFLPPFWKKEGPPISGPKNTGDYNTGSLKNLTSGETNRAITILFYLHPECKNGRCFLGRSPKKHLPKFLCSKKYPVKNLSYAISLVKLEYSHLTLGFYDNHHTILLNLLFWARMEGKLWIQERF
jgi:hypothetical protein